MKSTRSRNVPHALFVSLAMLACSGPKNPASTAADGRASGEDPEEGTPEIEESPEQQLTPHAELLVPVDRSDPQWGAANASVTLVQFADLECPFSAKVAPVLEGLMTKYGPDQLRVVFKSNPLSFHKLAPLAHDAAHAVYTIAGPGTFERYKARIFSERSEISEANLKQWAELVGVPEGELTRELASGRPTAKVVSDQELAAELGVRGTPEFFINGISLAGAHYEETFVKIIDAELATAKELLAAGADAMEVYPIRLKANYRTPAEREAERGAKERTVDLDRARFKIPVLETDPIRGPKDALVTVVYFSDFQCPFCSRVVPTLERVRTEYGKDVRIVWKDNPLPFHPSALPAAKVARYILKMRGNDAFWGAHDQFVKQSSQLGDAVYEKVLQEAGLSLVAYQQTSLKQIEEEIAASVQLTVDFEARGTPHFFINGRRLPGAQPFENFKAMIDNQLESARLLVDRGVARADVYDTWMNVAEERKSPGSGASTLESVEE